jgi:hypothetical protein
MVTGNLREIRCSVLDGWRVQCLLDLQFVSDSDLLANCVNLDIANCVGFSSSHHLSSFD